jgi:hypothetical protein
MNGGWGLAEIAAGERGALAEGDRRGGRGRLPWRRRGEAWWTRAGGWGRCGLRGRRGSRRVGGGVPGAGGIHGGATRAGVIRGWGEDVRRGQNRGRGHGSVVDALRAPP